jgi:solute carrier family 25 (mitochondrial iron transporter), member 28/37
LQPHLTAISCLNKIIKEEGIRALYRSYPVTVLMNIPFATTVVCVNENLKTWTQPWNRTFPYLWYFLCAGAAGALAAIVTNPLDVIKTRLQTQDIGSSIQCTVNDQPNEKVKYTKISQTIRLIREREGLRAFTKGVSANIVIFMPSTALTWGSYELIKHLLGAESH